MYAHLFKSVPYVAVANTLHSFIFEQSHYPSQHINTVILSALLKF